MENSYAVRFNSHIYANDYDEIREETPEDQYDYITYIRRSFAQLQLPTSAPVQYQNLPYHNRNSVWSEASSSYYAPSSATSSVSGYSSEFSTTSTYPQRGATSDFHSDDEDEHEHHVIPSASGAYCLECHERELDRELRYKEQNLYENTRRVVKVDDSTELYARLLCNVLIELRESMSSSSKMKIVQKRIQKAIFLRTSIDLSTNDFEEFQTECKKFAQLVERRLRVVRDYSPQAFTKVSERLDKIFYDAKKGSFGPLHKIKSSLKKVVKRIVE